MNRLLRRVDRDTLLVLDALALSWVTLWLVLAVATAVEVWRLSALSDSAEVSADAVQRVGRALQSLSGLPVVGDAPAEVGKEIAAAAADIDAAADQARADARRLSILLGLAVFLVPVTPVLALYAPMRSEQTAEVNSIRDRLERCGRDQAIDAFLASRAVRNLTLDDLLEVSSDPVEDLRTGHYGALAAAELRRLGIADGVPRAAVHGRGAKD